MTTYKRIFVEAITFIREAETRGEFAMVVANIPEENEFEVEEYLTKKKN